MHAREEGNLYFDLLVFHIIMPLLLFHETFFSSFFFFSFFAMESCGLI